MKRLFLIPFLAATLRASTLFNHGGSEAGGDQPAINNSGDTAAVELGVQFQVAVPGQIRSIFFWRNNGGYFDRVSLWDSAGHLLSSAPISANAGIGWNEQVLPTPVTVNPNKIYVASYHVVQGGYPETSGYFSSVSHFACPLLAAAGNNGVYVYGASAFPTGSFQGTNYFCDVDFEVVQPQPTPVPTPNPTPVPTPTPTPQPTPTPTPGSSPTPTPSATPVPTPTPNPNGVQPAVALPTNYSLLFDEEFNEPESTINSLFVDFGPFPAGARWMRHTPYFGDFANFASSNASFPGWPEDLVSNGLDIKGWNPNGTWYCGLLSSMDNWGNGFYAKLGYWEAQIWIPPLGPGDAPNSPGLFPAFWLNGADTVSQHSNLSANNDGIVPEVDIMEAYSVDYTKYHTTWHAWKSGTQVAANGSTIQAASDLSTGWHVFSCLIQTDFVHFYLDGKEVWKDTSTPDLQVPMYVMVNLAFGGGWPVNENPANTYHMYTRYVRCWAPPQ